MRGPCPARGPLRYSLPCQPPVPKDGDAVDDKDTGGGESHRSGAEQGRDGVTFDSVAQDDVEAESGPHSARHHATCTNPLWLEEEESGVHFISDQPINQATASAAINASVKSPLPSIQRTKQPIRTSSTRMNPRLLD